LWEKEKEISSKVYTRSANPNTERSYLYG
jgi:hypothetical protein